MTSGYVRCYTATSFELQCQHRCGYKRCMKRSKKLEPMSIRLGPDVKAELQDLADADDRSLSAYINRVLRQHVEAVRKKAKTKG